MDRKALQRIDQKKEQFDGMRPLTAESYSTTKSTAEMTTLIAEYAEEMLDRYLGILQRQ
jgi:hypothetical protein